MNFINYDYDLSSRMDWRMKPSHTQPVIIITWLLQDGNPSRCVVNDVPIKVVITVYELTEILFFYPEIKTNPELNWKELFNFRNLIYIHSSLLFSFENQPPSYPNPMIWSTSSTYINKLSRLLIYSELIHTHFNSQHCTWASHVRDWNLCRFNMWLLAAGAAATHQWVEKEHPNYSDSP